LRKEAIDLQRGSLWIDDGGASIDDEYRWAGTKDPKIIITTSHDPSSRLKVFAKVML
jgi:U3 small nucleolar ribonucleoprotein protein IMP4